MKFKKLLALILSLILTLSVFSFSGYAAVESDFRFSNGEFKIMIFTDIHESTDSNSCARQIMREALEKYMPDLVVLLGDNTVAKTLDEHEALIERITAPMREKNIPYAAIFGNHDDQSDRVTKEALLEIYRKYGCVSYDDAPEIYGCGNFNLPIMSSDGRDIKLNLWFFDSGSDNPDKAVGGYDYVRKDQIEWYKETAAELREANGGRIVPALSFQHIILPQVYDALYPEFSLDLGKASNHYNAKYYSLIPKFGSYQGFVYEPPQPPYNDVDGELEAFKQVGDIMASFSGHDHVNSFVASVDTIDLVCVPTVHNKNYSNATNRGAGLITVKEDSPDEYEYQLITAAGLALEKGSQICEQDGSTSRLGYFFAQRFADLCLIFQRVINLIFHS